MYRSQIRGPSASARHRPYHIVVANAAKILKDFGRGDDDAAKVILVLSDADDAFALPYDRARQDFVWIEDLTEKEANECFDKAGFLLEDTKKKEDKNEEEARLKKNAENQQRRRQIFDTVGTRPAKLWNVIGNSEENIDATIDRMLRDDEHVLNKILLESSTDEEGVDFRAILDALKKNPEGVSVDEFKGKAKTSNEEIAAKYFKQYHAFLYHHEKKEYQFYSKAVETAAKRMK